MHPFKKIRLERSAGDVRRLQAALDERMQAVPDNTLEIEMIMADLRRATLSWRRLMQEVLAPDDLAPEQKSTCLPTRNPLELPAFAGAG